MFRKILLPIDLTQPEMTTRAISEAQCIAKAFNGAMRLVNVQSLIPINFVDYVAEDFDSQIRAGLEREMAIIASDVECPSERVSTAVLFGPVHHMVLAEAESWGADIIIICSHRPGMDRFLIGSNASAIVRHAKCSVLVVRPSN